MPKNEIEYEIEAKKYVKNLSPRTQKLAAKAIEDCLDMNRSWRWINTALNKKGYSNWERWSFGLFFSKNFNASVEETMKREDEAEETNLEGFFSVVDDELKFSFPQQKEADVLEDEEAEKVEPLFYYRALKWFDPHAEAYNSGLFEYPEYILEDIVLERNIPAIRYGLTCGDIPQELVSIYEEALSNYAGDVDEQ